MNLSTAIYLTELIDNAKGILLVLSFLLGLLMVLTIPLYLCANDNGDEYIVQICEKVLKKYWLLIVILGAMIPLPSKEAMYLMLGSSYLEQSNIPTKVSQALELKLDDYIKELRGTKE